MKKMHKYTQTSNMERLQLLANVVETTMRKRMTAGLILSPRSAENQTPSSLFHVLIQS